MLPRLNLNFLSVYSGRAASTIWTCKCLQCIAKSNFDPIQSDAGGAHTHTCGNNRVSASINSQLNLFIFITALYCQCAGRLKTTATDKLFSRSPRAATNFILSIFYSRIDKRFADERICGKLQTFSPFAYLSATSHRVRITMLLLPTTAQELI